MSGGGQGQGAHVIEYAAQEVGGALVQRVYGIIDALGGYAVLPDDQQGQIRLARQRLRVGEHGHRRRVDNDQVHFFPHIRQQLMHLSGRQQLGRTSAGTNGENGKQLLLFQILRLHFPGTGQHAGQLLHVFPAKKLVLRGLVQVRVHQQHFFPLTGQRQRQIGGHSGLALILCHARDQYHFPFAALGRMIHLGSQLSDLFCEVEANGRRGDQQALLAALQPGAQGLVLLLVVDGGKQPGVHLAAHGVGSLHGIRQYGDSQQYQRHTCCAEEKGELDHAA